MYNHESNNEWALITGAAGGIGFAFAERLALLGCNLALADRDGERLGAVAKVLRTLYEVDVRTVEIDLSASGAAVALHEWCTAEDIEPLIVINNAGVFSHLDIAATPSERIELMAGLHVTTTAMVCRLFGEEMARRGRGYLLNMSSYSLWMAWPGLAMYSATKAFIRNFSLSLSAEMRDKGVGVTVVMPAGVTTGLYGLSPRLRELGRRLGLLLTPERTAELVLRAMFRRRRQYVPCLAMRLVLPIVRTLPPAVVRFLRRKTLRFQK